MQLLYCLDKDKLGQGDFDKSKLTQSKFLKLKQWCPRDRSSLNLYKNQISTAQTQIAKPEAFCNSPQFPQPLPFQSTIQINGFKKTLQAKQTQIIFRIQWLLHSLAAKHQHTSSHRKTHKKQSFPKVAKKKAKEILFKIILRILAFLSTITASTKIKQATLGYQEKMCLHIEISTDAKTIYTLVSAKQNSNVISWLREHSS